MNNRADETLGEQQLRRDLLALENSTESRDLFRLAQARKKALSTSSRRPQRYLWPALGTSLASVTLIVVLLSPSEQPELPLDMATAEINEGDSLYDIYEELDFYHWLALNES